MSLRSAALVLLSMTACVSLLISRSRLEGWHGVEVGEVRIVAEASADELDTLASDLAGFDAAFAHLIGSRIESRLPTTIYLLTKNPPPAAGYELSIDLPHDGIGARAERRCSREVTRIDSEIKM